MTEQTTCTRTGEPCTNCGCQQTSEQAVEELSAEMNHSDADGFLNLAPPAFKPQYLKPKPLGETAYSIRHYTAEDEKWFEELGY